MEPFVSIIIITYNRAKSLQRILPHLHKSTRVPHEILVIDDGSTDDTSDSLSAAVGRGEISYYRLERSGVAKARNFGISKAKGNFVSFIDSDIICLDQWLERLVQVAGERPDVAIFGAARYNLDDPAYNELFRRYPHPVQDVALVAKIGIGASLVRKELFDAIGGFDSNFVFGWEDTEFCWRANLLGYKVGYVYSSTVLHLQDRTAESRVPPEEFLYESMKNRLFTHMKLMDYPTVLSRMVRDLAGAALSLPVAPKKSLLMLRAYGWTLKRRADIARARAELNQSSKVSPAVLRKLEQGESAWAEINDQYLQRITQLMSTQGGGAV